MKRMFVLIRGLHIYIVPVLILCIITFAIYTYRQNIELKYHYTEHSMYEFEMEYQSVDVTKDLLKYSDAIISDSIEAKFIKFDDCITLKEIFNTTSSNIGGDFSSFQKLYLSRYMDVKDIYGFSVNVDNNDLRINTNYLRPYGDYFYKIASKIASMDNSQGKKYILTDKEINKMKIILKYIKQLGVLYEKNQLKADESNRDNPKYTLEKRIQSRLERLKEIAKFANTELEVSVKELAKEDK